MKKRREFGELESLIIQELKKKKKGSVSDIHSSFKEKIAYTTIMTVMNRLFEKSILLREKSGRNFIYWLNDDTSYFSNILEKVKEKIFGGKTVDMVSYLLENNLKITKEEIEKIEALIKEAKKSCK